MISTRIKIALGLLLTVECSAQNNNRITGEWIEVRRESRTGFVYDFLGRLHEPSIEITFSNNGRGTFLNRQIPVEIEPKLTIDYEIIGDSLLAFGKVYEIVKLRGDSLVLIRRNISKFKSEDDFKFYFLRKEKYDLLSDSEKKRLASPTRKDEDYLNTIRSKKE